jgi:ectoine hydroxylase-related dioxygenase (phytanoyl-CoA dioxygenase family)
MRLAPHPWSRGFAQPARTERPVRLGADQIAQFDEAGFLVVEDALAPELVAEVIRCLDPQEARVEQFLRAQPEQKMFIADARAITFTVHPAGRDARLREIVSSGIFAELAHDLVSSDVRLYWDQAVYKKTERPTTFSWHQDNGYGFVSPEAYLTLWIALSDVTTENGCVEVLPGLHKLGTLAHRADREGIFLELPEPVPADLPRPLAVPLRAGSLVAFSSLLPHRTGPNRSGDVRRAYIVQYCDARAAVWRGDPARGAPSLCQPVAELPADQQWRVPLPA